MRMIGRLSNENQASRLSAYLKSRQIGNTCEGSFEAQSGFMSYEIWIHEDDQIPEATAIFEEFQKSPASPEFDSPIIESPPPPSEEAIPAASLPTRTFATHLTTFFIALCCLIFYINTFEESPLREKGITDAAVLMTPIQSLFLYDLPPSFEALEKAVEKLDPAQEIPADLRAQIESLEKLPYWHGASDWLILKIKGEDTALAEGSLFAKIRAGEVWRLFTPCLMHGNLLHILFNMIWVWVLGRPIERRIGSIRFLFLILITGIVSNTVQYFMSGPFFLGFSGVVMALAGFTWMREKRAPWEGYPLNRATFLFLLVYIGAMFALQVGSFVLQIFTELHFTPSIANSAHIAGGIVGALLGRLSYFAQRVPK